TCVADHALSGIDLGQRQIEVAFLGEVEELRDASALGMDQELGVSILSQLSIDNIRSDASVDVALAGPDVDLTTRLIHHICSDKHVGQEQNLPIPRNTINLTDRIDCW